MAEKSVTIVLEKLLPFLREELKLLSGVSVEVRYIGDELERMQVFLQVADATKEPEENVKICVKQVRDVVYDTEDVLEEFMLHLATQDDEEGCLGFLCKMVHYIKNLQTRHQIASDIKDIKRRVQDISEGCQRFHFKSLEQGSTSTSLLTARSSTWHDPRGDALLIKETELVGFDKPRKKLIGWLLDGATFERGTISVVGMGGLGKTTLVKKVYEDQQVKEYFESHAWITVSHSFDVNKLLKDMIQQLFGESKQPVPQELDTKNEAGLKEILNEFLAQKRYVVVYDDIWGINACEVLKYALPNNNCGSWVMVTTRSTRIASFCVKASYNVGHVYELKPLPQKESRTLFCKKAFGENTCPPHLKDLVWSILAKCEGLPLAIVAIGGLLATNDNTRRDEWEIVNRSLAIELEKNDQLKSMTEILSLSYNALPYHLKPCFLYLSLFPKDHMIKSTRLIRLWVAEGFIEEQEGRTLEEVGKGYLNELINRSLIQIAETTIDGRIRRCRVHDLVYDIILSKSKDQNFGTIKDERKASLHERIRRLSVHKSCELVTPSTKNLSQLRSLIMMKVNSLSNQKLFAAFRLLNVLDLRGMPLETFPSEFINLFHLRYLCLRRTKIRTLPNSIEKLQNLETLDLKHAYVSELPTGIMKLQKLRHLLVYHYTTESYLTFEGVQGFKIGREIGRLTSLQKLCFIGANNQCGSGDIIRELGSLNQLRRLGIQKLRREDGKDLCHSIEKMSNLRALSVASTEENETLDLQTLSSPPPLLQRLYMRGHLEKLPRWIPLLDNLTKIRLSWSYLTDDPLEALQDLPNLVELELLQAYDGESLCFKPSGFQGLKLLSLDKLDALRWVRMEKGTMPQLQKLDIGRCGLLEELPFGIELLDNLKRLNFIDMPDKFVKRLLLCEGDEEHSKLSGIQNVFFTFWKEGVWKNFRL